MITSKNKKSLKTETRSTGDRPMTSEVREISDQMEAMATEGLAIEEIIYRLMSSGNIEPSSMSVALEHMGYTPDAVVELFQKVELLERDMIAEQQAQQQAAQQAAQAAYEEIVQDPVQQYMPGSMEQPVMRFGGARPAYLPPLPRRGNILGASLYAADAFEDLFSKKDRNSDGVRDGAFQDMSAKRARYKNKQQQNRTYDVDFKGVDPSNYVVTWQDLAEGNVRTKGQFEDDVKNYSQLDFDPVSNRYFGNVASSEFDRSMLGKDQIKNLEKSISLGDFIDNVDALRSTKTGEDDLAFIKSGMNYKPGTGLGYRPGQYTIMNAEGKPEVVYTGEDEAYSYNESGLSPAELRRRRAGQRDIMLAMRDGGSLPKAQGGHQGLAEFTAQVPVYNAAGECILNCKNLRVDPKYDYEIGANLTAGMLNDKFTGSGKITSGFSFNPNRGLGGIDGYVGGNIGGRAIFSDNDKVNINPFANLISRLGYKGRLPRKRSGLFGAKGAPYSMGAFYNKSLMGNEGDVVGGYASLGKFNVTGGYNTTTNAPQFTVGLGIPIKKSGGQSLPKAQMGNEPEEVDEVLAALQKQYSFPETIDMSGLANVGMEPFEEQEAASPFDLQNRLTSQQMAAQQAQVAPVGVVGSQTSPDFTSGVSQVAQKAAGNTMQQRQAQKNQDDFDLNQAANQIDWTTANEELDRIAYNFGQDSQPQEGMVNIPKKDINLTEDLNTVPGIKPQGLDTSSPSVKRKRNLSNFVDQAETFIKDDPAMRAYGATSNALVMGANLANEYFQEREFQDYKNKMRGATMADKIYSTVEDPVNVRGTFDTNTGLMEPDNLVDYYSMAKKGGEFKPHMMYDPKTGKGYKAKKYEDHVRMDKLGYTHDIPKAQTGKQVPYGSQEYRDAYNNYNVYGQALPEIEVYPDGRSNEPYWHTLTEEDKRYWNDKSPIGEAVRLRARLGNNWLEKLNQEGLNAGLEYSGLAGTKRFFDDPIGNLKGAGLATEKFLLGSNPMASSFLNTTPTPEESQQFWNTFDAGALGASFVSPLTQPIKQGGRAILNTGRRLTTPNIRFIPRPSQQTNTLEDIILRHDIIVETPLQGALRRAQNGLRQTLRRLGNIGSDMPTVSQTVGKQRPAPIPNIPNFSTGMTQAEASAFLRNIREPLSRSNPTGSLVSATNRVNAENQIFGVNSSLRSREGATAILPSFPQTHSIRTIGKNQVKNKSGFTKDELLGEYSHIKDYTDTKKLDKNVIENMSDAEFADTFITPDGRIVGSYPDAQRTLIDASSMDPEAYVHLLNSRLNDFNDIIRMNNKLHATDPITALGFKRSVSMPSQTHLTMSIPNNPASALNRTWIMKTVPGQTKSVVQPHIGNFNYYDNFPGLRMSGTSSGTVLQPSGGPARGTGVYKSLNDYLKTLDAGRVGSGQSGLSSYSRGLWRNAVDRGKASGVILDKSQYPTLFYQTGGELEVDNDTLAALIAAGADIEML